MSATTDIITVTGIADCHGIESMVKKDECDGQTLLSLMIRANANRQRHTVLYEVDLSQETFDAITTLLKDDKFEAALTFMKAEAEEVRALPEHAKSWDMIPNPKFDPWH